VKKLLVASVGEDIEAKVDYLTQDKARLAADMRQFSYQISKDFEEKEKLSVQSDVWKSKFLACRLVSSPRDHNSDHPKADTLSQFSIDKTRLMLRPSGLKILMDLTE